MALGKEFNPGWHCTSDGARRGSDGADCITVGRWGRHGRAVAPSGTGTQGLALKLEVPYKVGRWGKNTL